MASQYPLFVELLMQKSVAGCAWGDLGLRCHQSVNVQFALNAGAAQRICGRDCEGHAFSDAVEGPDAPLHILVGLTSTINLARAWLAAVDVQNMAIPSHNQGGDAVTQQDILSRKRSLL
jgi:hypothetical protein